MKFVINILFVCVFLSLRSQTSEGARNTAITEIDVKTERSNDTEVFTIVEEVAEFPGGVVKMNEFIRQNIVYPKAAIDKQISGKCFVKLTISSIGKIVDPVVLKGVPDCPECDDEALRVVRNMPDWKPARMAGKNVSMYYNLPIRFMPK